MFEIIIYEDEHGRSNIREFINELEARATKSKDARVNRNKVIAYLDLLEEMGTRIGMPVTRHLEGDIWELRPLSNRILYAYYKDNKFLLLHQFTKKTQKTPKREIEQALQELEDWIRRH